MKYRNTLILFAVVIILFVFVYVFEIRKPEQTEEKNRNLGKLLLLDSEYINKIELRYADPNYERIVCSRGEANERWQIDQPLQVKADQLAIGKLLAGAMEKNIHNTLKEPGNLSEYGLDNPRVTAIFSTKNGVSRILTLGNTVPTGNYAYIKQDSVPDIYLAPASIVDDLTKFVSDLRNRKIMSINKNVLRIKMEYVDDTDIICEKDGIEWRLIEPISAKADSDKVEKILSDLRDLKVDRFVAENPDDLSVYGLDLPQIKISISFADGKKILLLGQKENSSVYAKIASDKPVFLVNAEIINNLPRDLRDKTILVFDKSAAEKLEFKYSQSSIEFQKSSVTEDTWEITAPTKSKASVIYIDQILTILSKLMADEFVPDKSANFSAYGLNQPQVQVEISLKGAIVKTLLVGKRTNNQVYVKTASEEPVYLVDSRIADALTGTVLNFRDAQMLEFNRDNVERIELKRSDAIIACIKQERDWRIVEPIREKAKNFVIIDILRKLEGLKAEKFVAEKANRLSEYGLEQPDIAVMMTLQSGDINTLMIGRQLPGSDLFYAKIAAEDVIFLINRDVVDELQKGLSEIRE